MNAFSGEPILSVTPADLAPLSRWVAFQTENWKGKPTKVPYDPVRLGKARANDPRTWGTRARAEVLAGKLLKPYGVEAVGIELGDMGDGRISDLGAPLSLQ
jgi:hypothetical protein